MKNKNKAIAKLNENKLNEFIDHMVIEIKKYSVPHSMDIKRTNGNTESMEHIRQNNLARTMESLAGVLNDYAHHISPKR